MGSELKSVATGSDSKIYRTIFLVQLRKDVKYFLKTQRAPSKITRYGVRFRKNLFLQFLTYEKILRMTQKSRQF